MAKGIFAFGTLVGKLGDVIYYRSGGQQHSRPRIRKPKNPQTNKQLFQRARFSAAGMFYSHGRQAFFPYSFEDKKQNESYFNAFMRNNTHLAYPVSKSVVNNVSYPILQNWVVTKGSLPTIEAYRHSPDNGNTIGLAFNFPLYSSQNSINTMADLSRALIATGDFDNGDILTFLTILTDMRLDATAYGLYPEIVPVQSRSARWFIRQFNVNTADTTQLSSYNIAATITEDNEVRVNVWGYNTSWWPNQLAGGTIVHSRVKGSHTQVSTQALVLSEVADEQINSLLVQNYAEYVDAVINNWRTSEQDIVIQPTEILQGSNSINFNFQPEPGPGPTPPEPDKPELRISAGELVNGFIRPASSWIGQTGRTDQRLIDFQIYLNGEIARASLMKIASEQSSDIIDLPEENGSGFNVGYTGDEDWEASFFLQQYRLFADTSAATSDPITSIYGIKIESITINGVEYTEFTYTQQ